jgi:hypothetical protein
MLAHLTKEVPLKKGNSNELGKLKVKRTFFLFLAFYQKELVESPKCDREKLKSDYSLLQFSSF